MYLEAKWEEEGRILCNEWVGPMCCDKKKSIMLNLKIYWGQGLGMNAASEYFEIRAGSRVEVTPLAALWGLDWGLDWKVWY